LCWCEQSTPTSMMNSLTHVVVVDVCNAAQVKLLLLACC
jgi:hypothetical protein